jgi:membrane fusion protein, multidrug efflux system
MTIMLANAVVIRYCQFNCVAVQKIARKSAPQSDVAGVCKKCVCPPYSSSITLALTLTQRNIVMDEAEPSLTTTLPSAKPRASIGKIVKWSLALLVLVAAIVVGVYYWQASKQFVSTNNAYVNANTIEIAAQVSGPITEIYVQDQQAIKAGDPLFQIDPRPYELAVAAAEAQRELAQQSRSGSSAAVDAARAQVALRVAELRNAESNQRRALDLLNRNLVSQQDAETIRTQAETAAAARTAAEASLAQAQSSLGRAGDNNATVRAALAKLDQAKLDFDRTKVIAPTAGMIANFTLRPGSTVQAQVPLFTLIGNEEFWVDANFKETELDRVRVGQHAEVVVDMYRNHPFEGVVESLSGGSGQAFSLLPAQNATGNWVKVTQRVPVKIRITNADASHPLKIGTTATVHVRTDVSGE